MPRRTPDKVRGTSLRAYVQVRLLISVTAGVCSQVVFGIVATSIGKQLLPSLTLAVYTAFGYKIRVFSAIRIIANCLRLIASL